MKLASLLSPDQALLQLGGDDRRSLYRQVAAKLLEEAPDMPMSAEEVAAGMIERENTTKIPYEKGFAYPHLRHAALHDLHVVVAVLEKPVQLKENDLEPTRLLLAFLISEKTSQLYLNVLSAFTRFLLKKNKLEKLIRAECPEEFVETLERENVEVKHGLTAEDIMDAEHPFVSPDDSVSYALNIFTSLGKMELPVLGEEKKILGRLAAEDIVRRHIPESFLMLDNLKFLRGFEPFDKLLGMEESLKARGFMTPAKAVAAPDTPIIQVTVPLVRGETRNIYVVRGDRFLGVVSMSEIVTKILRG